MTAEGKVRVDTPKQYDIRTMEDLLTAARESLDLDTLMSDLRTWVELNLDVETGPLSALFTVTPVFRWNDDGIEGIRATHINVPGGGSIHIEVGE